MEIKNNSIIHTVRLYAQEKFGVELSDEQVSADLRELNFSDTLSLTTAIKDEDDNAFSDLINLSIDEGYTVLPPMDRERYQERDGLEGPFTLRSGKVVYYDPREGKYYDPDTDYYMDHDEYFQHDKSASMKYEAQSPGVVAAMNDEKPEEELEELEERKVAGAPGGNAGLGADTVATASRTPKEPDTTQQDDNSTASADNTSAIDELKKLAGIK